MGCADAAITIEMGDFGTAKSTYEGGPKTHLTAPPLVKIKHDDPLSAPHGWTSTGFLDPCLPPCVLATICCGLRRECWSLASREL